MSQQEQESDELAVIEQLLRPVSQQLANPDRVTVSASVQVLPLDGLVLEFSDGQHYPLIAAARLPDADGYAPDRYVIIRQMPDFTDRYAVQTVYPDPDAINGWRASRSRYRINLAAALAAFADRVREAF
jgi:hypothetical protein